MHSSWIVSRAKAIAVFSVKVGATLGFLYILGILAVLIWLSGGGERFTRAMIPAELQPNALIAGTFNDANGSAIFEIDAVAARKFVQRNSEEWKRSPVPLDQFKQPDCLYFACATGEVADQINRWLQGPGAFYLIDSGPNPDRTSFVINPDEGRIAVVWQRS
jgi:hypothetical protein